MTTTVTATATCSANRGVVEATGQLLNAEALAQRVGWMSTIVQDMAHRLVTEHCNRADLTLLAAGIGADGRALPRKGWMAVRRLGWASTPPAGLVVSDRVRRIAEEHSARLLRLALHREHLLAAVIGSWPANPGMRTREEWAALWTAAPAGMTKVEVRNRTRQAAAFLSEHDRLPTSVAEAEPAPYTSGQMLFAAADKQQVALARRSQSPDRLALRALLPAVAAPASYRDWEWVEIDARIPAPVPMHAALALPTLRLVNGRVRVDLPFVRPAPLPQATGHRRGLGVDWVWTGATTRCSPARSAGSAPTGVAGPG
jgi:hypothetical protein